MKSPTQTKQSSLINKILQYGKQAFDPLIEADIRNQNLRSFNTLIDSISTPALLPALNLLVQPGRIPDRLREKFISILAQVPLRPNGVQDTIEFILSIHPSTININATSKSRVSCVTHEALNAISRLLSSPPASISAEDWFNGIAHQLFSLLLGKGGQEMDKIASYVIGFGILGRKQYGSPGSPGWNAIVEPLYTCINPSDSVVGARTQNIISPDGIEYVELRKIISTPSDLMNCLSKLISLVTLHPHPSLANRILRPILYSLWTLSCWPYGNKLTDKQYRNPARKLLKVLLRLSSNNRENSYKNILVVILDQYICERQTRIAKRGWEFVTTEDGGIQIEIVPPTHQTTYDIDLLGIDAAVDFFVELLKENTETSSEASSLFIRLGSKWLAQDSEESYTPKTSSCQKQKFQSENEMSRLIELKILEKLIVELPEKLIDNSKQLLEFTCQILRRSNKSNQIELKHDVVPLALSLLNITIIATSFRITAENRPVIDMIEKALETLAGRDLEETSRTARNILMLIRLRDTVYSPEPDKSPKEILKMDQHSEDKKTYNLALSYLTGPESLPPVRVQGLELLSSLLEANSPIIDVPSFVTLLTSLLLDEEEYVHLRVIKLLVQLSQKHPMTTMKDVIDRYVDPDEECELDQRLRLGEALHQMVQSNWTLFKYDTSNFVCEGLLFVGSRRGSRPKTKERQAKAINSKNERIREAEREWSVPIPLNDEETDFAQNEDLAITFQIVSAWESSRGSEDIRIRSSALAILGTAIKANIQCIKSQLISAALDLSIHILSLEREIEKAILRRAAVVLILNFIQALDSARTGKQNLKFGLADDGLADVRRIIQYVEGTDNDNLVREHCRDVIESLESWPIINSLVPPYQQPASIRNIAGLTVAINAPHKINANKSKIVEVE